MFAAWALSFPGVVMGINHDGAGHVHYLSIDRGGLPFDNLFFRSVTARSSACMHACLLAAQAFTGDRS